MIARFIKIRDIYKDYYGKEVGFMNAKTLKILGLIVNLGGAALSVAASVIGEKQQDLKIKDAVAEAAANLMKGES